MQTTEAIASMAGGLAIAVFFIAAVMKIRDRALVLAWLVQTGLPRPSAIYPVLVLVDLGIVGVLVYFGASIAANAVAVGAALVFLAYHSIRRTGRLGACPCLGRASANAAPFLLLLVLIVNVASLLAQLLIGTEADVPLPPKSLVLLMAISFSAMAAIVVRGGDSTESRQSAATAASPVSVGAGEIEQIMRSLEAKGAVESAQAGVSILFGSPRCDGCIVAGKLFSELARVTDTPCLIDMDVAVPTASRIGGAKLVKMNNEQKRLLGISARPTLLIIKDGTTRTFVGLDQCLHGIAKVAQS